MAADYRLWFYVEWNGGCLWPAGDAAYERFGFGPVDGRQPEAVEDPDLDRYLENPGSFRAPG